MSYQWDPHKARVNYSKYGIRFADAVSVFADDYAITIEDKSREERRFVILGHDAFNRLLIVIYTYRGDEIRLISARKATAAEHWQYEE